MNYSNQIALILALIPFCILGMEQAKKRPKPKVKASWNQAISFAKDVASGCYVESFDREVVEYPTGEAMTDKEVLKEQKKIVTDFLEVARDLVDDFPEKSLKITRRLNTRMAQTNRSKKTRIAPLKFDGNRSDGNRSENIRKILRKRDNKGKVVLPSK